MAFSTKVYDADQVSIVLMGIPISSGYADGAFLKIEQESADFTVKKGTDGSTTRSKTLDFNAKITLMLMQSSDGNAQLSAIRAADLAAPNGAGIGPMLVRDRAGTSLYTAAHCWIEKPPDVEFAREASPREWTLHCSDLVRLDGGN